MLKPWLKLFRVVNLPTVPGDVLVGAAAAMACLRSADVSARVGVPISLAVVSSVFMYMFGLADNDIIGAAFDKGRPIPDGEISMRDAKLARGLCLALGFIPVLAAVLWLSEFSVPIAAPGILVPLVLAKAIVSYNRLKSPLLMGACRGLNVLLGVTAAIPPFMLPRSVARAPYAACVVAAVVLLWTAYIAAVTWYSNGEERDPERRRKVGLLVGGIVYMQLVALIAFTVFDPTLKPLLVAGAVLLVLLRVVCRAFPKVSAS